MHKKAVPGVELRLLSVMVKQPCSNRGSSVGNVNMSLFGKLDPTRLFDVDLGLSCGLSRVIPSGGFAKFLATVLLPLITLRTTGLAKYLRNKLIIPRYSIWFMMQLIFIRTAVC
jgi:hypothetical protein